RCGARCDARSGNRRLRRGDRRAMSVARLADPYRLIYRHRRVLFSAVRVALKARYAGSILGLGWVVVGPLLLLALYAFVYAVVFRIRPAGLALGDYILYI